MGHRTGTTAGGRSRAYLSVAAFGLCATCLLAMVPVTFAALSGGGGLGYAVPVLLAALAVAVLALAGADR